MCRYRAFWPLVLLLPLLLLALTGCASMECEANPGPDNFDPHFLSANGLMYLNSPLSHSLYALDMKSGSIRWASQVSGTVVLDSGILSIEGDYTYTALDASTGSQLWHMNGRDGEHLTWFDTAADHLAYFTRDDGTLEAVNGRTGTLLWHYVLKEDPALVYTDGPSEMQAVNGVVYVSTANYSGVYAFRERDGALLWQFHGSQSQIRSTAFGDGMVFVSANQTYALRMSDGKLLWNATQTGGLLEANGMLYVNTAAPLNPLYPSGSAGTSADVFAFRASDGKPIWHQSFAPTGSSNSQETYAMQVSENQLYLVPLSTLYPGYPEATAAALFAFRASDGMPLWKDPLPTRNFSLVAVQGVLYLFAGTGRFFDTGVLEAVRETDGAVLWSQSVQEAGMIVGSDAMYLGTAGNTDDPCAPKGAVQLEKRQMSTAALIWHRQLDPAPAPSRPVESILGILGGILGGLLLLLGLLLFFLSLRSQPRSQSLSPPPGDSARVRLSASMLPRVGGAVWLLLALVGLVLLCAGLLVAQGTP
jgi:outer membrane protein assembly factor BamB